MPIEECSVEGEPGVKWGDAGKCYTYDPDDEQSRKDAVQQALAQGIAIGDIDIERGLSINDLQTRAAKRYNAPGLVVLIGPPGAGKTTWLDRELPQAERVDLEQIRREPNADRSEIITNAVNETFALLREGKLVAFDSTGLQGAFRSRLRGIAKEVGVQAHAVIFDVPLEDLLSAQKSRQHPVPADRVRELHGEFVAQRDEILNEDWASAVTITRTDERARSIRQDEVDLTPTAEMAEAASKGLRLYEEGKGGDGLVEATIRDARRMAAREPLSEEKVRRMPGWWARHSEDWTESDTEPGEETPGYVAALLWGIDSLDGSPGATWAERKVAQLDAEEERSMEQRDDAPWMTPRQRAIYEGLESVADTFGVFDKSIGADGLHYIPAEDNPWAEQGLACQACAFYKGGGVCELLAETDPVEPEGLCKYWLVPDANETPMPTVEGDGEEAPIEETPDVSETTEREERERSYSPVPIEYRESGAGSNYRVLTGYAAVWDKMSTDLGGFREKIARGAFTKALERADTIKMLYDHDTAAALASTANGSLELREDEVGLHVWARVDMDDPDVQRVAAKLRSGVVDQMSFAFSMDEGSVEEWDYAGGMPVRTIRAVSALFEVSAVSMPAYNDTRLEMLERARQAGRLPALAGATDVAPEEVGGMSPEDIRDADPRRSATYWHARLTQRKQETRKWTS